MLLNVTFRHFFHEIDLKFHVNRLYGCRALYDILVVMRDYESAFDALTLIYVYTVKKMISLADFQPLSIANYKI